MVSSVDFPESHLVTARQGNLAHFLNPATIIESLWANREMIWQFTRREVEGRYRGSFLGLFWSLVNPLVQLSIYTFIFGVVLKSRWAKSNADNLADFALVLFCGIIPFTIFSECTTRASSLVISVPNYVKKVVFPLEILPLSVLGSAVFHSLVSLGVLLVGILSVHRTVNLTLLLVPLVMLPLLMLCLGLSWFLAGLGVFIRDVNQTVVLLVQMLFFLTPIFYSVEAVPASFRPLIHLNPLTSIVENFRRVLLWDKPPNWGEFLLWLIFTAIMMILGFGWFMKTKRGFADVI
jgi:lipopolysaccharide transport system permease protein